MNKNIQSQFNNFKQHNEKLQEIENEIFTKIHNLNKICLSVANKMTGNKGRTILKEISEFKWIYSLLDHTYNKKIRITENLDNDNSFNLEFHYRNGSPVKIFKLSFEFLQLSDRDFAKHVRKIIKKHKSVQIEQQRKEAMESIKTHQKEIERLTKFIQNIEKEQDKESNRIVNNLREKIELNNIKRSAK